MKQNIFYFITFLVIPAFEVYLFLLTANIIGLAATIMLVMAISLFGCWLFRYIGARALWDIWDTLDRGKIPTQQIFNRFIMMIGACFIIIPGFITLVLGLLLFIPPIISVVRTALLKFAENNLQKNLSPQDYKTRYDYDKIIDGEYEHVD